jgi:hypothetical protein
VEDPEVAHAAHDLTGRAASDPGAADLVIHPDLLRNHPQQEASGPVGVRQAAVPNASAGIDDRFSLLQCPTPQVA